MTFKDAIDKLKFARCVLSTEQIEACDIAIKALEEKDSEVLSLKIVVIFNNKTRRVYADINDYTCKNYILHITYCGFIKDVINLRDVQSLTIIKE